MRLFKCTQVEQADEGTWVTRLVDEGSPTLDTIMYFTLDKPTFQVGELYEVDITLHLASV